MCLLNHDLALAEAHARVVLDVLRDALAQNWGVAVAQDLWATMSVSQRLQWAREALPELDAEDDGVHLA
ncbi:hypothetical protein SLNSH_15045 [Alsobacter soli]|uniref:Uncharacterized protein n=1 Tax=Alsobacter soli TaxID=2109933 RepID=A0A2T1HR40_9HYPH|nr:hypothetical protein [Alsobacter soli]PSC04115.1 hypothetical protein SLNSH_15045 [Alsobacter soli]